MAQAMYPIIALIGGYGSQFLARCKDDTSFWHWGRDHYTFPPEYTDLIDDILMSSYGLVGRQKFTSISRKVPEIGYHYLYNTSAELRRFLDIRYITFEKVEKKIENTNMIYYRCYVGGYSMSQQKQILGYALTKIFKTSDNKVRTISIDTSSGIANIVFKTITYDAPHPFQKEVANWIINEYEKSKHKNIKIIISGKRGTGKSYIARIVKRLYEDKYKSHFAKLFIDFKPANIGVNVNKLILPEASDTSPVIVLLDEIDVSFKDTLVPKNSFDSRTHHTKDKQTFVDMMDSFGNTPNVIFIGTTELSTEQLYDEKNEDYYSYTRPGRIDYFVELDRDPTKTKILKHNDIANYPKNEVEPLNQ